MAEDQEEAHDTACDNGGLRLVYGNRSESRHMMSLRKWSRQTQEYKDYIHMVEVLQRKPELYDEVMVFRRRIISCSMHRSTKIFTTGLRS